MPDEPQRLRADTIGKAVLVEPPDAAPYLIAEITIDCDICGQHTVRFAGHHLRAIRNFFAGLIDEYPSLTLKEGDVRALEPLTPGNDPRSS